ncbi:MAG TPA: AAA family ATPase [Terriglobales bacterium]|nr:AAA family ATPase [Terriglobales bacterium]
MPYTLQIPKAGDAAAQDVLLSEGQIIFILGPNGSGKSALMYRFYSRLHESVRGRAVLIPAHRQMLLESNSPTQSTQQFVDFLGSLASNDRQPSSRFRDGYHGPRPAAALFQLVSAEHGCDRRIAEVARAGGDAGAHARGEESPLAVINRLLRDCGVSVQLQLDGNGALWAGGDSSARYGANELSDGERNALLIAILVLTAQKGSLVLIDEPERHLHRSIASPLLSRLFRSRPDCAFVVSTHEISLAADYPEARSVLLRSCTFHRPANAAVAWDFDVLAPGAAPDEDFKREILGARRKILFVEGTDASLDRQLYQILFPDFSVFPKQGCTSVKSAVKALNTSPDLHWIIARGLVDGDQQTPKQVAELRAENVFALDAFSVKSVYYHPELQLLAYRRHQGALGRAFEPDAMAKAKTETLAKFSEAKGRVVDDAAQRATLAEYGARLPGNEQIAAGLAIALGTLDVPQIRERERERLGSRIAEGDVEHLLMRYPIRKTGILDTIARVLGFSGRVQYEDCVLALLRDDPEARALALSLLGVPADLEIAAAQPA